MKYIKEFGAEFLGITVGALICYFIMRPPWFVMVVVIILAVPTTALAVKVVEDILYRIRKR